MSTVRETFAAASSVAAEAFTPAPSPRPPDPPEESRERVEGGPGLHDTDSDVASTAQNARSLLKLAGSVVAPTTFVTALLIYFGWSHAYWFFYYFGVNSTLLDLTTQDYLMRSVDGLFIPIMFLACIGIVGIWVHRLLQRWVPAHLPNTAHRILAEHRGTIGFALATIGLWGVMANTPFEVNVAVSPTCLGLGAILLTHGSRTGRSVHPAASAPTWVTMWAWAGMFVLAGLSLFWVANDYSADVGISRARQLEQELNNEPSVSIYSAQRLALAARGVREAVCEHSDAAYQFRYDGLKLVMQAGDQYLFLPEEWTPRDGTAILMPRDDKIRLEFSAPSADGQRRLAC